jgi:hypothetical protein
MRTRFLALVPFLTIVSLSRGDDAPKIKEIVDRAITAHAGSGERLNKLKRIQFSGKGALKTVQGEAILSRVVRVEWGDNPEYYHNSLEGSGPNGKIETQLILEGLTKGRQVVGTLSKEFNFDEVAIMSREVHAFWVGSLLPLRDGGVTLSLLPAGKVDGVAVVGVKAEKRNRPTVELYFDTQTHLLKKLSYLGLEAGGVEVRKELTFGDYKDFDGIKMPTKESESHDGRKKYDWTNGDYKFPDKIERK